jgi:hypothetical protein
MHTHCGRFTFQARLVWIAPVLVRAGGDMQEECNMDPVFLFLVLPIAGVVVVFVVAGLVGSARRF